MNLPRLGHAVIINNIASEMPGSKEDVKALKDAYETVGFEVQVHENCSVIVSAGRERLIRTRLIRSST